LTGCLWSVVVSAAVHPFNHQPNMLLMKFLHIFFIECKLFKSSVISIFYERESQ